MIKRLTELLHKWPTTLLLTLPVSFFLIEKLIIVVDTGLKPDSAMAIFAVFYGILRELLFPLVVTTVASITPAIKTKVGKWLIALLWLCFISIAAINIISFTIGSTPLRAEYLFALDPTEPIPIEFASASNLLLLMTFGLYLWLTCKVIIVTLGKIKGKSTITASIAVLLMLLLLPRPQIERPTYLWQDAIDDAKANILLNYVYIDPATHFLNSIKLRLPTGSEFHLTSTEKDFLRRSGFKMPEEAGNHEQCVTPHYKNIIMIVFESLHPEYLHFYNPEVPAEATEYYDYLLENYPRLDNYYSSNYPTAGAIFSMVFSRIPQLVHLSMIYEHSSIFSLFKQCFPESLTAYLRNVNNSYGGDTELVINSFKMDKFIGFEALKEKYDIEYEHTWGARNDIVFAELFDLIESNLATPTMILTTTTDEHFPYYTEAIPEEELPDSVRNHFSPIVKTFYWNNVLLKRFFTEAEAKGLLNDETLFIVTSDHTPNPNYGHRDLVKTSDFNQLDKLPIIFVSSNIEPLKNLRKDLLCSTVDLPVTICALLGVAPPPYYFGRNLLSSATKPLRIGHQADHYFIGTASRSYIIPEIISGKRLSAEETAIWKYFEKQKTVEFNQIY